MTIVKEIKSIDLASYTIIATAIAVLFSVIFSIVIVIGMGIVSLEAVGSSLYLVSTLIIGTLMYATYNYFCQGFLYNLLGKKLNVINITLKDEKEITKVSTTQTATIISLIVTIQVILIYLVSIFLLPLFINSVIQTLLFSGQEALAYALYQFIILLSQPLIIAMLIFGTFVITFVFVLLGCYIYNILANTGRGAVVNLSKEGDLTAIDSVDTIKFTIAFGLVAGVLNLIAAIVTLASTNISSALISIVVGFISAFVNAALIAIFYNFLAPKLGKLKLELIDQ